MVAAATASEFRNTSEVLAPSDWLKSTGGHMNRDIELTALLPLDRVAGAVDGAESSHGTDRNMWHPNPSGPQGPMQVSEAAALDVGGGDRFDLTQNRAIGRAYLAQLYGRYRSWPDAIAAYNWGLGRMDAWVRAGRPPDQLLPGVAAYLRRVLRDSGLCQGSEATRTRQISGKPGSTSQPLTATLAQNYGTQLEGERALAPPRVVRSGTCSAPDSWDGVNPAGKGFRHFTQKLDQALQLAMQRAR